MRLSTHDLGGRDFWLMPIVRGASYHDYDVIDHYRVNLKHLFARDARFPPSLPLRPPVCLVACASRGAGPVGGGDLDKY